MKNNVLKVLGVGALCCVGALTFAGCSAEVSQEQTDQLIESAQTAGDNLQSLKDSNLAQQELIKELNKKIDELTKQSKKLTADEAYRLLITSQFKTISMRDTFELNYCMNNVQVAGTTTTENQYIYKTNDGTHVILTKMSAKDVDKYTLIYKLTDGTAYEYNSETGKKQVVSSFDMKLETEPFVPYCQNMIKGIENAADYLSCSVDENGNFILKYLCNFSADEDAKFEYSSILSFEISADGYIIGLTQENFRYNVKEGAVLETINAVEGKSEFKWTYGIVTEADVEEYLETAKNAPFAE